MIVKNQKFRQSGSAWRRLMPVAVLAAPFALVGCLADDVDVDSDQFDPGDPGALYSIGGEVAGVEPEGVVLSLGDETLEVDADGEYEFETRLGGGDAYEVVIEEQPEDRNCGVANASGEMPDGDLADAHLHCTMVSAAPDIMQMHLEWSGPETANIKYSSDPDCDWSNYSNCDDGGQITDATGNAATIVAVEEELQADAPAYFVVETDAVTSEVVGARPAATQPWGMGGVEAFANDEERLFVGGDFAGIGMFTPGGVTVDTASGSATGVMPRTTLEELDFPHLGLVVTALPDEQGGWYIAGVFSEVDGVPRPSLAHIRADGSVNPDFESANDLSEIIDLALHDGRLYVAGGIDMPPQGQQGLVVLDAETGELDTDFTPFVDGAVISMAVHEDHLYVGGNFDEIDGDDNFENLAAFDLEDGSVISNWRPEADGQVWTVTASNDTVYVGGNFDEIDGDADLANLAAIDAESGEVDTDWDAGLDDEVLSVLVHGDNLYVAGSFEETSDDVGRSGLAAFDLETAALDTAWAPEALDDFEDPATVRDLSYYDGNIYVGGDFVLIDDELTFHAASVSPDDGGVDTGWRPWLNEWDNFGQAQVWTVSPAPNGEMYIGGFVNTFFDGNDHFHMGLAAFDRETGVLDHDWVGYEPFLDTRALAVSHDRLYVGGGFETAGEGPFDLADLLDLTGPPGQDREGLAAFDAETGELDAWNTSGVNAAQALTVDDTNLYAGLDDDDYDHLAAFDLDTATESPVLQDSGTGEQIRDLLLHDGLLYVGGDFPDAMDDSGVATRDHLAAFNTDTGDLADWDPEVDDNVHALAYADGTIYVGGAFNQAEGSEDRNHLAAFDATDTNDPGLEGWDPDATNTARSLYADNGRIYAGGAFEEIGGTDAWGIAALDAATGNLDADWEAGMVWDGQFTGPVNGIHVDSGFVHTGGEFILANEEVRLGLASFDTADGTLAWDEAEEWLSSPEATTPQHAQPTDRELPGSLISHDRLSGEMSENHEDGFRKFFNLERD